MFIIEGIDWHGRPVITFPFNDYLPWLLLHFPHDLPTLQYMFIIGGRDRQGGPVITFPPHQSKVNFSADDVTTCLKYLSQIPR